MKLVRGLKPRSCGVAILSAGALLAPPALAVADTIGPITFEPPTYAVGDINAQNGWMKTGAFDAAVGAVASFPAASRYGFGVQALRISNAVTSGSFGDQTFSPGLAEPAGESEANRHFEASFSIGTARASQQPGLKLSVSPDDGFGSRMSYLRFEDQADGVHVFFDDATNPGPLGGPTSFNETEIATLARAKAHRIRFSLDLKPGPANDVVRIRIDRKPVRLGHHGTTGTTWEDYYRFDPEQNGNGNVVPTVSKLLFRESGAAVVGNLGSGFLVDKVSLLSSSRPGNRGHDAGPASDKGDDTGPASDKGHDAGPKSGRGHDGQGPGHRKGHEGDD
jgi:hypothetical protein